MTKMTFDLTKGVCQFWGCWDNIHGIACVILDVEGGEKNLMSKQSFHKQTHFIKIGVFNNVLVSFLLTMEEN